MVVFRSIEEILDDFDHVKDPTAANKFFDRQYYKVLMANGSYRPAMDAAMNLLGILKKERPVPYETVHKGTPFYWIGTLAYLCNEFDTAAFFMDAAMSEDIRQGASARDSTPSILFLTLNDQREGQAALELVRRSKSQLENLINGFSSLLGSVNCGLVRSQFLSPFLFDAQSCRKRTLVCNFISFLLEYKEKEMMHSITPPNASVEPFATHLLKGCVLFEHLLKYSYPSDGSRLLSGLLNSCTVRSALGLKEKIETNCTNWNDAFLQVRAPAVHTTDSVITFAAKMRNFLAHNVAESKPAPEDYKLAFELIGASLLLVVKGLPNLQQAGLRP